MAIAICSIAQSATEPGFAVGTVYIAAEAFAPHVLAGFPHRYHDLRRDFAPQPSIWGNLCKLKF